MIFKEKRMLLPPLKFTDLDKIFTGDTSHYDYVDAQKKFHDPESIFFGVK